MDPTHNAYVPSRYVTEEKAHEINERYISPDGCPYSEYQPSGGINARGGWFSRSFLIVYNDGQKWTENDICNIDHSDLDNVCPICYNNIHSNNNLNIIIKLDKCKHMMHKECFEQFRKYSSQASARKCPLCRESIF